MNEQEQWERDRALMYARQECVKLAVQTPTGSTRSAAEVLDDAKKYFDFVKTGNTTSNAPGDISADVDSSIVEAAQHISQYFEERGIRRWAVGNVRSRD